MKSFVFPGNIEKEILEIGNSQIPYMRSQWFSDLIIESNTMLLEIADCDGKVIPFTGSGTMAMESCIAAFVHKKKTLIINAGTFGSRWREICEYYSADFDQFTVPFGEDVNINELEKQLELVRYEVILLQHHETSSGSLLDVEKICKLCKAKGIITIVDSISSFCTDYFSMKTFHIDIAIVSSQKGLDLPPGLSFVIIRNQLIENIKFEGKSFYLDWETNLSNLTRGQTPYSPATQLFMQLHERLERIKRTGVTTVIDSVKKKALAFRNECEKNGWLYSAVTMSNCVTGIYLPFRVKPLVTELFEKGVFVMPCGNEKMLRIAHTGCLTVEDHLELIKEIKEYGERK